LNESATDKIIANVSTIVEKV